MHKIEKEIEYWTRHQELDKFNFGISWTVIIPFIAIFISLINIVSDTEMSNPNLINIFNILKIVTIVFLFLAIAYFVILLRREPKKHNLAFMTREEMIKHRYKQLGIDKSKLDKEFEDIKKIVKKTKDDSECRRSLIKEYYSNNRK